MNTQKTFAAMAAVIEAPDAPLKHYKQDFYKYDREFLERSAAPGNRYIWVVRNSGTHLTRLGVHRKLHEEIEAALSLATPHQAYLVEDGKVTAISDHRARALMSSLDYETNGSHISKHGKAIAGYVVKFSGMAEGKPRWEVSMFTDGGQGARHTLGDLVALWQIASCVVVAQAHSLFASPSAVYLDGVPLADVIDQYRQEKERLAA